MHDTLQHLFLYKAWANDELLTALARLGDEHSVTKLAIKALSHSQKGERSRIRRLRRGAGRRRAGRADRLHLHGRRSGRMTCEEMLADDITHGVGHRAQVSAVMLLNSLAPASGGFTTCLHKAEAATRKRAAA